MATLVVVEVVMGRDTDRRVERGISLVGRGGGQIRCLAYFFGYYPLCWWAWDSSPEIGDEKLEVDETRRT